VTHTTFRIAAGKRAALDGRRELDAVLGDYPEMLQFDARLCLTELVTNALEHAGLRDDDEIVVEVDGRDGIRVDIAYPGRGFVPPTQRPMSGTEKGRGLALVDAVAKAWGAEPDEGRVWFELGASSADGRPSPGAARRGGSGSSRFEAAVTGLPGRPKPNP
jgi:anti-sigma regulatory factor (Ser/Thr protein kinase)